MTTVVAVDSSNEPLTMNTGIEEKDRKALCVGLSQVLADSYVLMGKTHGFHWNIVGPQFGSLHALFEEQYTDLFVAIDKIAERIRALGFFAPGSLSQFKKASSIDDETSAPDAKTMLRQLVEDHETVSRACREVVDRCGQANDTVTEDLMNERMQAHEQAAWMLRASLPQD